MGNFKVWQPDHAKGELNETAEEEINELLGKYNFDLAVLKDINYRLSCCREEAYARQQLRYLNQIIMGFATEKRNNKILINEKRKIYG